MKVNKIFNTIHDIKFKNVTIFIDYDIYIFFGNINNDNRIEIKRNVKMPLLNKFKIEYWDDYTDNLFHIKFLLKYSPIFSKLIFESELNDIEVNETTLTDYDNYHNYHFYHYINSNDGRKFCDMGEIYNNNDSKYIEISDDFLKFLNE